MTATGTPMFPDVDILVKSPSDFAWLLKAIQDAIVQRTLVQVQRPGALFAVADVRTLSDAGPWPDYVEAYFEKPTTGAHYKLAVETYHGAGGTWARY